MTPEENKEITTQAVLNQDQLNLIKSSIAKGATDDELKLFLHQCSRLGLDPLAKQVHFVKYGNNPGTVVIGVDGFRLVAARTGKHDGTERGVLRDKDGKVTYGWAKIFRKDWSHPAYEEVPIDEYYKTGYNGKPSMWDKMPETMIKKVAEVAALRMAFPAEFSGIYSHEEMDQAHTTPSKTEVTEVLAPDQYGAYVISFGKFKGMRIDALEIQELENYFGFIEQSAKESGKKPFGAVLDFLNHAEGYLAVRYKGLKGENVNETDDAALGGGAA